MGTYQNITPEQLFCTPENLEKLEMRGAGGSAKRNACIDLWKKGQDLSDYEWDESEQAFVRIKRN